MTTEANSPTTTFKLSGDLKSDATGLWQRLHRGLGLEGTLRLSTLYLGLFNSGGCTEADSTRAPGASFAPRPTRLASLALDLKDCPSERLLAAAMRAGACRLTQVDRFSAETDSLLSPQDTHFVAGLRALDDLRHLHMQPSKQQQSEIMLSLRQKLSELSSSLAGTKLLTLLESAVSRYERHHTT